MQGPSGNIEERNQIWKVTDAVGRPTHTTLFKNAIQADIFFITSSPTNEGLTKLAPIDARTTDLVLLFTLKAKGETKVSITEQRFFIGPYTKRCGM